MVNVRKITDHLYYVGADDNRLALFENIHPIKNGVSYNAYLLLDEKTVLFDTVDWACCRQFIENIDFLLKGRPLDYLVINHVEPDHAASIEEIILRHPEVTIISNQMAFTFMEKFGFSVKNKLVVKEGDTTNFGKHTITYVLAPMVHWPEAMVSYEVTEKILFSSDAFGTFGALNGALFNDEVDFDRDFIDDARRYYTNIVGKFGAQTTALLNKAKNLEINLICPLHGPVWRNDHAYFIDKHEKWASYTPEKDGVLIVYASMYGNTEQAAISLASKIIRKGFKEVKVCDVSKTHVSELVALSFKYSHIVLACATYNLGIFPPMEAFLHDLKALNLQKRTVAIIENGTWACTSSKLITKLVSEMKDMEILDRKICIHSTLTKEKVDELDELSEEILESLKK